MKRTRTKIFLLAALAVAGNFSASAQSSNGVPGDQDYAKFASFVTDRNIFDPNRYPHNSRTSTRRTTTTTRRTTRSAGTPFVALVGTMSYEKGMFAFFNANDSDMKQILIAGDEVAGYTVKEISAMTVTLVDKNKKELTMKVGEQMHQDGANWKLDGDSSGSSGVSRAEETASPTTEAESSTAAPAETPAPAASANLEGNDILKRLMEKRAKENQ